MANKQKGEFAVTLGRGDEAKEYVLAFDLNALADLEDRTGLTVPEIMRDMAADSAKIGIGFLIGALTAGLQRYHRSMTKVRVGVLMDPNRLGEYGTAIGLGLAVAMGADPDKFDEPKAAPPGEVPPTSP